jgi:5-methylcytosine-specific restriction endonuclease McrA
MRGATLRRIFDKTAGHCHFCGDAILFENRGWADKPDGHWEVDHVIQRHKGGLKSAENCLPACTRCNRLRWHRTGDGLREVLLLGVLATKEIKLGTETGKHLEQLRETRLADNVLRRIGPRRASVS